MENNREKFYKKPPKFGAMSLYSSKAVKNISSIHWKEFDENVKKKQDFKVGDFIDLSVEVTAKQLVKFLDEFVECKTIEEVKEKASQYINEIQKDINLSKE